MSERPKNGPVIDSGTCRCCGNKKRCRLLNVEYEFMGKKEVYSDMFVDCFGLVLSHLEGSVEERLICATCVARLREARVFRTQVLTCEEKLLRAYIRLPEDEVLEVKVKIEEMVKEEKEKEHTDENDQNADHFSDDLCVSDDSDIPLKSLQQPTIVPKPIKMKIRRKVKPTLNKHLRAREEMLHSMKKTREKLKKMLRAQNSSDLVKLQGKKGMQKSTKAFCNTVTIIENSYVCPFQSIFNNFYCDYCREKFTDVYSLRVHSYTHDPSSFKDAIINSMRRLGRKKTLLDVMRIDCRLCQEQIDDIETFKSHITSVHGKRLYPVENEFLQFRIKRDLKCTECGMPFQLFQSLKKHMAEHFGSYICDVCGAHFFNENYLNAHQRTHDDKQSLYTCNECGKSFKLKYSRDMHVTTYHRKEAAFQCIKCDEMFFTSRLRYKHMIEMHGEKKTYTCSQCDRIYDNRKTLLDHMRRIHVKLLKHKCNLCERRFYLPSMLKDHMSIHTGEKKFKCDCCGKSYPRLKSLKVHLQSHEVVKKYKCNFCAASYGQNVSLKNHLKREHQHFEMDESA